MAMSYNLRPSLFATSGFGYFDCSLSIFLRAPNHELTRQDLWFSSLQQPTIVIHFETSSSGVVNVLILLFPKVLYHRSDRDVTTCPHNRQLGFSFLPFSRMHTSGSRDMTMRVPLRINDRNLLHYFSDFRIFGSLFPHFSLKCFSSEVRGSLPHILLDPTVQIYFILHNFVKFSLAPHKTLGVLSHELSYLLPRILTATNDWDYFVA
jgi:hypothetical protein